jgi:RNA polymerase sigma-70 factor (ECF subfamily)
MVYGVCRLLLRDADEAEDAAQQVFLSAHQSLLGGTEPREAAAWLGAIARNECRSRIRARMATPLALAGEPAGLGADVEHVAGQRAEIEALCAALAELPTQQREAIVLREFYGLSYEEVSAALGLTDGAVESLLFRARKRLQAELRPARAVSGALALPLGLKGALASAVPGFASGSSGGLLAKLASLPAAAKLAAAAATVTAAGTIGVVGLRQETATISDRPEAPARERAEGGRAVQHAPARLARAPVPSKPARAPARRHEARGEALEEADEAEGAEAHVPDSEDIEAEDQADANEIEDADADESGESGQPNEDGADSDESGDVDGGAGDVDGGAGDTDGDN